MNVQLFSEHRFVSFGVIKVPFCVLIDITTKGHLWRGGYGCVVLCLGRERGMLLGRCIFVHVWICGAPSGLICCPREG